MDVACTRRLHDQDPSADGLCSGLRIALLYVVFRQIRVQQNADLFGAGHQLVQLPEPLGRHVDRCEGHAGDVAPGPIEIGKQSGSDGIVADTKDDWRAARCSLGCRSRGAMADDNRRTTSHQFRRQLRKSGFLTIAPAVFDSDILTLDEARLLQALLERCDEIRRVDGRRDTKKSDHRHRLLRPWRHRPRCRRAAEQRDELAPSPHSITSSASASKVGGISTLKAFAVARFMSSSNLAPISTGRSPGLSPLRSRATYAPARRYASV